MFKNLPPQARPALELPRETRATCGTCVMAKGAFPPDARDAGPFNARLKCCTYEPFIPNFSLGKIWAEKELPALKGRLTPLGFMPFQASSKEFGRDFGSQCSFLNEGRCSIWRDRPSVCRSYFCVSDQGAEGQKRWLQAEALGNQAEWTLAHEILWDMGFTQDETETFAEWTGREREFFIECARRAFGESFNGLVRV